MKSFVKLFNLFAVIGTVIISCDFIFDVKLDTLPISKLFCLQGSWSNTNLYYGSGNGSSSSSKMTANKTWTSDDMCQLVDLENTLAFPKPRFNPMVNPVCTYPDDYDTYKRLLKGPLYDYACYAQGKKCVKWTMLNGHVVLNVSRLCAVVKEVGCFSQVENGVVTEVCICDDQHFCNAVQSNLCNAKKWFTIVIQIFIICFINYFNGFNLN